MSRSNRRLRPPAQQPLPAPLRIERMADAGQGVAHVDGKLCFVDGALAGELVHAARLRRHANYDEAVVTEVLERSPQRVEPRCAVYGRCGGCVLQHQDHAAQVADKHAQLQEKLARIGGVQPAQWLQPLTGPAWHYRRRARLGVRLVPKHGGVLVGFRERRSSFITDTHDCPVLDARLAALIGPLRTLLGGLTVAAQVPQLEVTASDDEVLLVMRHLLPLTDADRAALTGFAAEHGVRWFLQPAGPDSVHPLPPAGDQPPRYRLDAFDLELEFGPLDFTQVNFAINQRLVPLAVDLLAPMPGERVADLFCGVGNFSLALGRRGARVLGLEGDGALVARARGNARRAGLAEQCTFETVNLCDDAAAALARLGRQDAWLLDPPRSGAQALCSALPTPGPARIVYVSCNPATLARDAGLLAGQGYRLVRAGIVDMFPHTAHVESIALFERA
ncbi:23S rRNA (uracil(1939)-C(5))-methyltransferase RlmD [Immundisolibacter sp.]|uniref:23S rRNA (uracil(1939)-C(5))-methyltransferase RlmD n=1 Tax=Immundisolibacter sp. TaxID=1934948 RepID=UPI0026262381|nr:23S rRNA (uracil(1939)-C(5))-methyltransferase RlmD [Immundisolibacter sp.]MDD3651893.1 23S rRNA (uracil(1939)-C(5))-methyltransferase RlmD [Immundisolibacter sp.]